MTAESSRSLFVAIDVGGTRMKGALLDSRARMVQRTTVPTEASSGAQEVRQRIARFVSTLVDRARDAGASVTGAGVAVPGLVDEAGGAVRFSANLDWRDVELREFLSDTCDLPVFVGQDVRAGASAEARLGAARGARQILFVPIGTGIAGALICDGRTVTGGGYAGELGHLKVSQGEEPCLCGAHGCLETVSSAPALSRRYAALTGKELTAREIAGRVAHGGDGAADAIWRDAVDALAEIFAACVTLLASEVIVVGGGVSLSGATLLEPLRQTLDSKLTFQRSPRVVASSLGDWSGCVGAGLLAIGTDS